MPAGGAVVLAVAIPMPEITLCGSDGYACAVRGALVERGDGAGLADCVRAAQQRLALARDGRGEVAQLAGVRVLALDLDPLHRAVERPHLNDRLGRVERVVQPQGALRPDHLDLGS